MKGIRNGVNLDIMARKTKAFKRRIRSTRVIRSSKELVEIINFVRARAIMEGRKIPRVSDITRVISKRIDKEELLRDVFIQF